MKKRDIEQKLREEGWKKTHSAKHEKWVYKEFSVVVPHSREISEYTGKSILKKIKDVKAKNGS